MSGSELVVRTKPSRLEPGGEAPPRRLQPSPSMSVRSFAAGGVPSPRDCCSGSASGGADRVGDKAVYCAYPSDPIALGRNRYPTPTFMTAASLLPVRGPLSACAPEPN